ncbi:MAG TPA: HAMP domain-containing sensor histidine kinase, partial [Terriglobales bacterium]|nr:HAMP domain-containing sensor histidine kinase [Terriglobales bacterium]
ILMERLEQRLRETRQALADLEQAQEALVHGERLRALGGLASGAAHHLNNILAVIVGRVDLLLDDVSDAARRRPLEAVAKAARDAAEIVRRVSEFARVRPRHGRRAVDLGAIVQDTLEATRQLWDLPGIELVTSIDPVPSLAGDAVALRDAVVHLVTNAVEAVPDGGRIAVTTRVAEARVELLVEDSGAGMTEDVRQRAFEPFFTTKGVQRRGLGLSAAYGIVTDHGGVIAIASEPGRGTRVTVQLPATVS